MGGEVLAMTTGHAVLPEFDEEMKKTRRALERVPDDKFDWKPHEKSMTMGKLAGHIAGLPGFSAAMLTTEFIDFDKGDYKPAVARNRGELLDLLDKNIALAREAIAGTTDDQMKKSWHMIYQGKKMFEAPRADGLRSLINHLVHHRGQLTVYLRLNEIAVPALYGPSADEA
jgi:uncharacterized damage-inducible protein DinB